MSGIHPAGSENTRADLERELARARMACPAQGGEKRPYDLGWAEGMAVSAQACEQAAAAFDATSATADVLATLAEGIRKSALQVLRGEW